MNCYRLTLAPRVALVLAALAAAAALACGTARAASITIAPGDTLSAIAARAGVSPATLASANGITDPHMIIAGTALRLPAPGTGSSAPAGGSGGSYRVRSGDTLSAIAARSGVSAAALASANGLKNPNQVIAGHVLVIPAGGASAPAAGTSSASTGSSAGGYRVQPGDSLASIASRYGTTPAALAALNGLSNPNRIVAGTTLSIPAGLTAQAVPAAAVAPPPSASSGEVSALLAESAARHGVDPALARAIAWQESRWTQSALSSVGAVGVMQLMPETAKWIGPAMLGRQIDPSNVADNIDGGVAFLGWLQSRAADERQAIGAYYQGLESLKTRGPYDDTKSYVDSVLAFRGRV
ncbi:MAG: LysM peptidoglycan-binding domain-containing protein [Thermoleophilia bacterium]